MAGLCRILTAVALSLHLMVGCCSHHAHASEGAECLVTIHGCGAADETCAHHANECEHSHPESRPCEGAKCAFVLPSNDLAAAMSFLVWHSATFISTADRCDSPAARGEGFFLFGEALIPPLRPHLIYQVLLI